MNQLVTRLSEDGKLFVKNAGRKTVRYVAFLANMKDSLPIILRPGQEVEVFGFRLEIVGT